MLAIKSMCTAVVLMIVLIGSAFLIQGCGNGNTHESSEARATDHSPADVHQMPRGFRNFAEKCDGYGHRVYVTSSGGSAGKFGSGVAVINDNTCPGGRR